MTSPFSRDEWRSVHKSTNIRDERDSLRTPAARTDKKKEKQRSILRPGSMTAVRISSAPPQKIKRATSGATSMSASITTPLARPVSQRRLSVRISTPKKAAVKSASRRSTSLIGESHAPVAPLSSAAAIAGMPALMHLPSCDDESRNLETRSRSRANTGQYNVPFTIQGPYKCVAVVRANASLWAANEETGTIDVYSTVSGKFSTQIPPCATAQGEIMKPVALKATLHHVWIGYNDGTVAVHDHLCLAQLTMGHFHKSPIVAFAFLANGITVSGSLDMALVRWDKEEKNFEAISRIVGVSEAHQALTCMEAFGTHIVLCGSMAGAVIVVDCVSGLQIATLRGHTSSVNAVAVMENIIFSSSEDTFMNIWSAQYEEHMPNISVQPNFYLLRRIPLQVAVRGLETHEPSRSLWVAYIDGLVERWSANPDDNFAVEQVVREAYVGSGESQSGQRERHEVFSLNCVRNVETMCVLALGSNGVSKVWCSHRNNVEESLQQSIDDMNAIITQDSAEAAVWEQKALTLKAREAKRKEKYASLLSRLHMRRVLLSYYTQWRARIIIHQLRGHQQEEICLTLEQRYQFRLLRRYFTLWCRFYDLQQRNIRRNIASASLEQLSNHIWMTQVLCRWWEAAALRKRLRHQKCIINTIAQVSDEILLGKFFMRWRCYQSLRRGSLPKEKVDILVGKSRQRVLRQAYERWKLAHVHQSAVDATKHFSAVPVASTTPAGGEKTHKMVSSSTKHKVCAAWFAQAYEKITIERERRRIFSTWRHQAEYRRRIVSLRALAVVREKQCYRNMMYKALVYWHLFCRERQLNKLTEEVQDVEKRLRDVEEMNNDIFEKLQLQKHLERLRRQQEQEKEALSEEIKRSQRLGADRHSLRKSLSRTSCMVDDDASGNASNSLFNPAVLKLLPVEEAMAFVMTRLKGIVLNIYTDMPLFRQIKDRLRCGTTAAAVFLESFQEVKRVVVSVSKKPPGNIWRSGERWPLTPVAFENLPLHQCATVVQSIKAMVVAYDMVGASDIEMVAFTRCEVVANADLLFVLWRTCYAARRPILPVNNRVAAK